jgi:dTMP kinase
MKGKLIVIEGTDCSGKETQTKLLVKYLKENNTKVFTMSFPNYDSPTGKIIGGPFLGKSYISEGYFPEGAPNVDPKVSSLYYAADRLYNLPIIQKKLNEGYIVILDRYVYSNMYGSSSR